MSLLWNECLYSPSLNSYIEAQIPIVAIFGGGVSKEVIHIK